MGKRRKCSLKYHPSLRPTPQQTPCRPLGAGAKISDFSSDEPKANGPGVGILNQYLGLGGPQRVCNPDPV